MESVAAQLSAAVYALIGGMLARFHEGPGYVGVLYRLNFARWGLEGEPASSCRFSAFVFLIQWT